MTLALRSQTTPGSTRREVWLAPAVQSHSLLVLTTDRLYLSPAGSAVALDDENELEHLIGAMAIDLEAVTGVRLELAANALTVERTPAGSPVTVTFASAEAGDEVYTKLWRRLGAKLVLRPFGPDPWHAARGPAALMAGILAATLALALAASTGGDLDSPPVLARLIAALDWRWVCAAGGVGLALAQVWLYRRLTQPPTRLELVRR